MSAAMIVIIHRETNTKWFDITSWNEKKFVNLIVFLAKDWQEINNNIISTFNNEYEDELIFLNGSEYLPIGWLLWLDSVSESIRLYNYTN